MIKKFIENKLYSGIALIAIPFIVLAIIDFGAASVLFLMTAFAVLIIVGIIRLVDWDMERYNK